MLQSVFNMTKEEERVIITTLIGAIILGWVSIKGIWRTLTRFKIVNAEKTTD